MPKSKELKRIEAIERKREHLDRYRAHVAETHEGTVKAFKAVQQYKPSGENDFHAQRLFREMHSADERHKEAIKRLHRLCSELKCDTHGNPL